MGNFAIEVLDVRYWSRHEDSKKPRQARLKTRDAEDYGAHCATLRSLLSNTRLQHGLEGKKAIRRELEIPAYASGVVAGFPHKEHL
jgi:hypothetical protein